MGCRYGWPLFIALLVAAGVVAVSWSGVREHFAATVQKQGWPDGVTMPPERVVSFARPHRS